MGPPKDTDLGPNRHSQGDQEGPLRVGPGPRRAPHAFDAEVDAGALLGETHAGADRDAHLVGPLPGDQRERKGPISAAEPDEAPTRPSGVGSVLAAERYLDGVVGAGPALRQEIAVGSRPGPVQRLAGELQLGPCAPAEAQAE